MMTKKLLIFGILAVLTFTAAQAQYYTSTNKKAIRQYEQGLSLIQAAQPSEAVKCMEQALKADPKFAEVYLTLGDLYMEQDDMDKARLNFEAFLDLGTKFKSWNQEARHALDCIRFRQYAVEHPVPFHPENMGPNINSPYDEYLPALTADGKTLIITRRMPRNENTTANTEEEEDFYVSLLEEDGWSRAVRMEEPVNSTDNEGAQCISQDGRIMIFTGCGRPDGVGRCDLYICVRHGDEWSVPRNLGPDINSRSWEAQPSLSPDGRTLYYVSDRKGGYGGKDIWYSTRTEEGWSAPKNMGPDINTDGDESCPFLHFDGNTLYFASNGHVGMGGSDLFVSRRVDDTTWSRPENLGFPINTRYDESNLIVSADGKTAYFSSDKMDGYGRQDLYTFELPVALRPAPVEYHEAIAEATELEVGESITLENILFATGRFDLDDNAKVELDKVVELLEKHPTMKIELGGHTDNVGSSQANLSLSEERAMACYNYMIGRGIEADRVTYKGYGESQPIADNDTDEGRARNRRTVFTVTAK